MGSTGHASFFIRASCVWKELGGEEGGSNDVGWAAGLFLMLLFVKFFFFFYVFLRGLEEILEEIIQCVCVYVEGAVCMFARCFYL